MKKKLIIENKEIEVDLKQLANGKVSFEYAGKLWDFRSNEEHVLFFERNPSILERHQVFSYKKSGVSHIALNSRNLKVEDALLSRGKGQHHAGSMVAPMPGKVLKVFKKVGDRVVTGETILVMEAMKMEHAIKATQDGVIEKIAHFEGEQVVGGVVLVVLAE